MGANFKKCQHNWRVGQIMKPVSKLQLRYFEIRIMPIPNVVTCGRKLVLKITQERNSFTNVIVFHDKAGHTFLATINILTKL